MAACRTHQARIVTISLIYPLRLHRDHIFQFNFSFRRNQLYLCFKNIHKELLNFLIKIILYNINNLRIETKIVTIKN